MGELYGKIDAEKLLLYRDDLLEALKDNGDVACLTQCLEHFKSIHFSSLSDFGHVQNWFLEYHKKIDVCKQESEVAKSKVAGDAELELLQKELEEELGKERLLKEELRVINNEINDLDCQRTYVEERKQNLKKLKQDELKTQRMLSMYASLTSTIPNLDDASRILGCIVDRDKKVVEKFEFGQTKMTEFDTCNSIWKMINSQ